MQQSHKLYIDKCNINTYNSNISTKQCNIQISEVVNMSEKEKEILKTFEKVIPKLNEAQKERVLGFGEGMAFKMEEKCIQEAS